MRTNLTNQLSFLLFFPVCAVLVFTLKKTLHKYCFKEQVAVEYLALSDGIARTGSSKACCKEDNQGTT